MSLTILEGPDGGGKSTLIKTWWPAERASVFAHGPYTKCSGDEIAAAYLHDISYERATGRIVAMDRCWISEGIYGPVARGKNRLDDRQRLVLEQAAHECHAVVVLCLPSYEACLKAYLARKELEYLEDETQLKRVYNGYRDYAAVRHRYQLRTFVYDYEAEPDPADFIKMVEDLR